MKLNNILYMMKHIAFKMSEYVIQRNIGELNMMS